MRSLANFEAANKKLETAKTKNKGLPEAETNQQTCKTKFDKLSETGKQGTYSVSACVRLCVCTFVRVYVCACVRLCVCAFVRVYVCACVRLCVCTFMRVYVCACVRLCVCTFVRVYVCACVRLCMCMFVQVCLSCCNCVHMDVYVVVILCVLCVCVCMHLSGFLPTETWNLEKKIEISKSRTWHVLDVRH